MLFLSKKTELLQRLNLGGTKFLSADSFYTTFFRLKAGAIQYGSFSAASACFNNASLGSSLTSDTFCKAMFLTIYEESVEPWLASLPPAPVLPVNGSSGL
ncbi:hypothetical protein BpHYR1_007383 [Brachionus plicatilis]|uniref:Uncharacterized protein n=1 Tax=Brachionus plicatilis TaxID=10195 RepID=A0A3M7P1T7_BRAPC|nr:hypothetical protein BpHYR1_007383 [Brachionus plicatilis]